MSGPFYIRHPDDLSAEALAKAESRDPDFPHLYWLKAWVPAYAGVTELERFPSG